jgi:hypothetical protein
MKSNQVEDGSWLTSGEGELRPILAEGGSRAEAEYNYNEQKADQYAEAQTLTHLSLVRDGEKL